MTKKCKNDQECDDDSQICSQTTSRCIQKSTRAGKIEINRRKGILPGEKSCDGVECEAGKICNPRTGRCVKKIVKKSISTVKKVNITSSSCPDGKIFNPLTGRCVSKTGVLGKKILSGKMKSVEITSFRNCKNIECPDDKVCNPLSKRCVSRKSSKGRYIERKMVMLRTVNKKRPDVDCLKRSNIKLGSHQKRVVKAFKKMRSMLIVHEPGMGKTLTAIACAECFLDKHPKRNVVVVTLVSLLDNFTKEFKKYGNIDKTKYIFISYETFLAEHVKLKNKACEMFEEALVIIDEAHELRNYNSKLTQAVMDCVTYAKKVLLLTATPYVNTVCDFISLINLLNRKYVVCPKIRGESTNKLYTAPHKITGCKGGKGCWWEKKTSPEHLLDQLKEFLMGRVSFERKGENINYPKKIIKKMHIPMTAEYEKKFLSVVPESARDDPFYGMRRTKVNALSIGDESNLVQYYSRKLKSRKILDMLENPKNKNVIFTSWIGSGLAHVTKILNNMGVKNEYISGSVSSHERSKIVRRFNKGDTNNLVITTAGMAGIDLMGVTNIIIIDPVWNDANLQQIIGRGVRYKSHSHLPEEKRVVHIYLLQLVEKAIAEKTMEIKNSRSGDLILYKFIEKKRSENREVEKMLEEASI